MYKFSMEGLEDKIKYIKPFSFFESVREKFKKANLEENFLDAKVIEESSSVDSDFKNKAKLTKEIYENNLAYMSKIYSKINRANQKIEKKSEFITESFNRNLFEEKIQKDLVYFKHILENVLPKGESKVYQELHETVLDLFKDALVKTIELYEETNVKPRYLSPTLHMKNLEESRIIDIYNTHFKKFLTENYIIPLRKGNIQELNENEEIKKITKFLIENNIEENIDNIVAYLPFEKKVKEFFENILIPETAKMKIKYFIESQDLAYFDIYEKNAKTIYESLDEVLDKIVSIISPFLFKKTVDIDNDVNPVKYAGITMVCKRINDGPMECTVSKNEDASDAEKDIEDVEKEGDDLVKEIEKIADEDAEAIKDELKDDIEAEAIMPDEDEEVEVDVEDEDDKDHDGKPDKEEDHGELPEDFKGDHKDAEKLKKEEEKKKKEKKVKEESSIEETETEPGVAKTIPYNKEKALKEADKEEIVPDEADDLKTLDDAVKTKNK